MITVIISEKDEFTRLGAKISASSKRGHRHTRRLRDRRRYAMADLTGLNPDVVILGGTENILDKCHTCQEVRTLCPTAKVLTLSEKQKDDDLYEIILSGASG